MGIYEEQTISSLKRYFATLSFSEVIEVENEWPAFPRDKRYSPRVDIAVSPFATDRKCISEYDCLCELARPLLDKCFREFKRNVAGFNSDYNQIISDYSFNQNARCFMAIEIENKNSRKHRLGDIVNASALGKIGLVIAWDSEVLRSFLRILEYFNFLKAVGKNTFKTTNIAVLERNQFTEILRNLLSK